MTPARERPRHCMVVHAYYPLAETRVQREAEALVRAGYGVDVICPRDEGESGHERYRGVEIHRVNVRIERRGLPRQFVCYLYFALRAALRLTAMQHRHRYRSVQVHNLPDFLVFCAWLPKLQRVPVVLDLHDLMPEFFESRFPGRRKFLRRIVRAQERLSCRFADHVITVSAHWRSTLIDRGVRPDKCTVVMNVADEAIFSEATCRASDPSKFSLVYHGTVTRRYGLDLAVRAVGRLRDEIPNVRLTILGKGDAMAELVSLRAQLELEDHVELRDEYLGTDVLPAWLARADLGVVPYRDDVFTDGLLPTKLMEYAAVGLPCVAARTSAIEAYFRNTMVSFFRPGDDADLAERVRELYRSPESREALALRSRNFVRRYSWTVIGKEYVDLVTRLGSVAATLEAA
jgi:glycosyltransferase involved in cell wall biosynthesis